MFNWKLIVSVCMIGLALVVCQAADISQLSSTQSTAEPTSYFGEVKEAIGEAFSMDDDDDDDEDDDHEEEDDYEGDEFLEDDEEYEYASLEDLLADITQAYSETEASCNELDGMLVGATADNSSSYLKLQYQSQICELNLKIIQLDMTDVMADIDNENQTTI